MSNNLVSPIIFFPVSLTFQPSKTRLKLKKKKQFAISQFFLISFVFLHSNPNQNYLSFNSFPTRKSRDHLT